MWSTVAVRRKRRGSLNMRTQLDQVLAEEADQREDLAASCPCTAKPRRASAAQTPYSRFFFGRSSATSSIAATSARWSSRKSNASKSRSLRRAKRSSCSTPAESRRSMPVASTASMMPAPCAAARRLPAAARASSCRAAGRRVSASVSRLGGLALVAHRVPFARSIQSPASAGRGRVLYNNRASDCTAHRRSPSARAMRSAYSLSVRSPSGCTALRIDHLTSTLSWTMPGSPRPAGRARTLAAA